MRVLLTGGAGFIGRHVLVELVARGHEVRVLDVRAECPGAELVVGDVRDASAVEAALVGADAVCHLAAKVGLGVDVQDLPDYAGSNDLAAGRFEPPCPRCGRALQHALVTEDARLDPRNAYAASKVAQEHLASSWARATGASAALLRYHNVYGPGMPRDTPYAGVAAIFASALRRGEAPTVFEDGGQRRDFVHVRDVASATAVALERHGDGVRAYNVGSGTPRTVGDLADELSR